MGVVDGEFFVFVECFGLLYLLIAFLVGVRACIVCTNREEEEKEKKKVQQKHLE